MKPTLPIGLTEQHDGALRFLHGFQQYYSNNKTPPPILIHYDAHPDLSTCPNIAPKYVRSLKGSGKHLSEFFEKLTDDDGGIAGWILPAVWAGLIGPEVVWIRDENWCGMEFPGGGKWEGYVGIGDRPPISEEEDVRNSTCLLCSIDDDHWTRDLLFTEASKLKEKVPFTLFVGEGIQDSFSRDGIFPVLRQKRSWCLDIDLDYFTARSPWLATLPNGLVRLVQDAIVEFERHDQNFDQKVFNYDGWARQLLKGSKDAPAKRLAAWQRAWKIGFAGKRHPSSRILRKERCKKGGAKRNRHPSQSGTISKEQFPKYAALLQLKKTDTTAEVMKVLGNASDMCILPHWVPSESSILEQKVRRMQNELEDILAGNGHLEPVPRLVTIARSCVDGFLPMRWSRWCETRVCKMLEEVYSGSRSIQTHFIDEFR